MKRNFTFRTLLVAFTLLLGGGTSWGETISGTVFFEAKSRIASISDGVIKATDRAGNGYALAIADMSGVDKIEKASSVTIEFDVQMASGTRWLVGIGDKDTRGITANGSSKTTYNTEGLIMHFGTSDGSSYRVNDGTSNSAAFGVLNHITFTLDRVNKTYSYTITNKETGNTTYFSASNVATDIDNATIVEAYSWLNNAEITISDVSYTIKTEVTYNGTSSFEAKNRITKNNDGTFTTDHNAGNAYALALADLSGIEKIGSAETITLEFDVNIASGSRWLIGIGDKDTRGTTANGSSKSAYNTEGLIMRFGTSDGSSYRVNGGTSNSDAFGVLNHITFTLDRVNKTYSYTIKNKETGNTYFSASNVATDISNATVVEAYSWVGDATFTISDVSYTFKYTPTPFDYTVKAVDDNNNVIKMLAEDTSMEKTAIYYPYAFQEGGKWYTTAETSYMVEVSKDDPDKTIVYTEDNTNIVAYVEGETGTNTEEFGTVSASYSNGKAGHVKGQNKRPRGLSLGTFAAGTYEFVAKIVGNAYRGLCVRNLTSNTASNDGCITWAATDNSSSGVQKGTFTLDAEYTLLLNGKDSGEGANQSADFDYAYIRLLPMTLTISNAEWATLYTPMALNFAGTGLKAYTATVANDVVTLTQVNDVPANTGVVLNGTPDDYTIPAIASSTTDKGDLKGSLTEALTYDANDANDYYMLALNGNKVQFTKLTSGEIAAGKAYLVLPKDLTTGARTLTVAFSEGGTTGISEIENSKSKIENYFNLNGQRVSKPTKGLYIVNGKKVVLK